MPLRADSNSVPGPAPTILVTGAAGFIGSHLCRALLQSPATCSRLIGIDNFDPFYDRRLKMANVQALQQLASGSGVEFQLIDASVCDPHAMRTVFAAHRPASVFHLAALAGVRPSIDAPARFASVNVDGLVHVLDAARQVGCRHIVFASSSSVYGNNRKVPFAETDAVDEPISPYAATKRAGELICHTYAHLFQMNIAALRFFTVYGPAQRPDLAISTFMRLIARGEELPMFGDGSSSRDYTYIDDIISGVLAAHQVISGTRAGLCHPDSAADHQSLPGSLPGGGFFRIWNLGNSHPISLRDLIDAIASVVGKPAHIRQLPMQPGDVERTWADLTRSRSELEYEPCTNFHDGLSRQWEHLHTAASSIR